jgi:hypothetical protein
MKLPNKIGTLLLAIWLILYGIPVLLPALTFGAQGTLLAILAVAAGIVILLDR